MTASIRILYDHQVWQMQTRGGISRYFVEVAKRLCATENVEVSVFAGLHHNEHLRSWAVGTPMPVLGSYIKSFPKTGLLRRTCNEVLYRLYLRTQTNGWNVFHPTYYRICKAPAGSVTVVTVFDMIHELFPHLFRDSVEMFSWKKKAIQMADRVIAISTSTKNDLVSLMDIPPDRVLVIPLANSLQFDHVESSGMSGPYILYVGDRRAPYKGFDLLLQVFAGSPYARSGFTLVAFGGGPVNPAELERIQALGLTGKVRQRSGDDRTLAGFYKSATAFVSPSLYEGFGIPLLEAMHWGCPVIASNTSSVPEIVGSAACLFEPQSAEALADALNRVLGDSTYRRSLVAAGIQREREFSWDKTARATLDVYQSVVD